MEQVLNALRGRPEVRCQKTSLEDQFDYRFALEADSRSSAFFVTFGRVFCILGTTTCARGAREGAARKLACCGRFRMTQLCRPPWNRYNRVSVAPAETRSAGVGIKLELQTYVDEILKAWEFRFATR